MKFRCPCGEKEMNIADEKLPADGRMSFPCPVCKKVILLDSARTPDPARFEDEGAGGAAPSSTPSPSSAGQQAAAQAAPAQTVASATSTAPSNGGAAPSAPALGQPPAALEPEMIPHGAKAALVAVSDPSWLRVAAGFFRDKGYYLLEEADPTLAAQKLLINAVDVALVEETAAWQPVLTEITRRPGLKRRETCLIVIGAAKSLDSYAAFLLGADWTLFEGDVDRAEELLGEMLARQEDAREPWRLAETP